MSNILDRLLCASANGERAPVDADDVSALSELYERSPGEHPNARRAVSPQRVPREPRLRRAGGRRVVVRHRPLRRLPRRLRHRGRSDGGARRQGELARRPAAGAPRPVLGALHRMAGASHRAARRRETSPPCGRATSSGTVSSNPNRGRRMRSVAPFVVPSPVSSPSPFGPRARASRAALALRRRQRAGGMAGIGASRFQGPIRRSPMSRCPIPAASRLAPLAGRTP